MGELFKAALTCCTVLLVMVVARRGGPRSAGAMAALPTITAPTLVWLAQERGADFAVNVAIGSVAACAVLAAFATGYALAARHGGVFIALGSGLAAGLALTWPALAASSGLLDALVLAGVCVTLAWRLIPAGADPAPSRRRGSRSGLIGASATAGGVATLAAAAGPALGAFAAGLLSSLPLVSGTAAMAEHVVGGHRAAAAFLRGYVGGLFGKAAFGAVFALLAGRFGTPAALALACFCTVLMAVPGARRRSPAAGASGREIRPLQLRPPDSPGCPRALPHRPG